MRQCPSSIVFGEDEVLVGVTEMETLVYHEPIKVRKVSAY